MVIPNTKQVDIDEFIRMLEQDEILVDENGLALNVELDITDDQLRDMGLIELKD